MNEFNVVTHLEELDTESKNLVQKAKDATQHAYAPYSKFLVGAAILLEDGNIITGTNQENAAYPSGMCAERVALFSAISQYPKARIVKIAVVAKRDDSNVLVPATSCGPCRQVMLEFETRQSKSFQVIMQNQEHQWVKASSAKSLLPFCFTQESLGHH
jgi:cytidine deaminase